MQTPQLMVFRGHCLSLFIVAIAVGLLGLVFTGSAYKMALSTLCGGLVFSLPALYSTLYAFRYRKPEQVAKMIQSFYWGHASKFSLVAMGFSLVFVFGKSLAIPYVFVGFCLMIPAHIVVAMFVSKNSNYQVGNAD